MNIASRPNNASHYSVPLEAQMKFVISKRAGYILHRHSLIILAAFLLTCCSSTTPEPTRTLAPTLTKIIPTETVTPTETPLPQVASGIVLIESLNIRSGPGINFDIVGTMKQGDKFYILADQKNNEAQQWLQIALDDNSFGWVIGEPGYVTQEQVEVDYQTYTVLADAGQRAEQVRLATPTAVPTQELLPTQAPAELPAIAVAPPVPSEICACSYNAYNCGDFPTHDSAQSCYNYCVLTVGYDVHGLDRDSDGSACETNP